MLAAEHVIAVWLLCGFVYVCMNAVCIPWLPSSHSNSTPSSASVQLLAVRLGEDAASVQKIREMAP